VTAIRIGGFDYFDRTGPLIRHEVEVDGLQYDYTTLTAPELGRRLFLEAEFDAGELWSASQVCATAAGTAGYIAIPVFPSRNFRHGFVFVHRDSDITQPEQLAGRRVGVVEYVQTAAVWIRGFLQHDFGVSPSDVRWVSTRQRTHAAVDPPAGLDLTFAPDDRPIQQLLFDGDVDAIIGAFDHRRVLAGPARRLFAEPRNQELDYYRRTGAYPIMHMVGIRRDVYQRRPSIATDLMTLYEQAKALGQQRLRRTSALAVSLPWLEDHLTDTAAVFGGDPFVYGLQPNLTTLRLLTQYVHEQGLTDRLVAPEELFAPETLDIRAD
jgi:4,5-dihydroxyphthalate decarboxylase